LYKKLILEIEKIEFPVARYLCEPNLSKRDLYSDHKLSKKNKLIKKYAKNLLNFLSYSDGQNSLEDISKYIKLDLDDTKKIRKILKKENLI
jgi:aminopeptidase-like protein